MSFNCSDPTDGPFDLRIDQGAEYPVVFTYLGPADPDTPAIPGPPINVTGWTALMQFRTAPGKPLLLQLTDSSGITVGTDDGKFSVAITDVQTAAFTVRTCEYDLFVKPPAAQRIRLLGGRAFIRPAISVAS